MGEALKLHPDSRCTAVTSIEVDAAGLNPGRLALRYVLGGRICDLRLPSAATPARRDGLWQHTCFEAFVRTVPANGYYEFNLAPSADWAAYRFAGYREGREVVDGIRAPGIAVRVEQEALTLQAELDLSGLLRDLSADVPWRLALSAVIEETDGGLSYWALAHPPGRPDFHHPDGFALDLSVRGRS